MAAVHPHQPKLLIRLLVGLVLTLAFQIMSPTGAMAADAPGTCSASVLPSPINRWIRGEISSGADVDWFRFDKPYTNFSLINLAALPKNYRLDLYNSTCNRLTGSNRPGTEFEEIYRSMPAGRYYVRVAPTASTQFSARQYALRLRTLPNGVFIVSSSKATIDEYGDLHIHGEVLNNSGVGHRFIRINATFYNSSNVVLKVDFTYTTIDELRSRGRSPFHIWTEAPAGYHHHVLSMSSQPMSAAPVGGLVLSPGIPYSDSFGYRYYPGEVANTNGFTARFTQVALTEYDAWANVSWSDFTFTEPSDIPSGATAPYELMTEQRSGVNRYSVVAGASR